MKLNEPMEFTMTIEDADLEVMAKVLKDIKIPACPYFDISDKYGNKARYYRENRWIPCSERLPEEYGEYRITWTSSVSKKPFLGDAEYEISGEWDSEHDRFKGEWLLDDYIRAYPDVKVTAWKPMEEPWEGEEE